MTTISSCISVTTLTINELNSPVKRHRLAEWIKKQSPPICCPEETHLSFSDRHCLRGKGWAQSLHSKPQPVFLVLKHMLENGGVCATQELVVGISHKTKKTAERSHAVSRISVYSPLWWKVLSS